MEHGARKEIPDEQLLERISEFGIEMSGERRKDALFNIKICIDNEKIMKRRKRKTSSKNTADTSV